MGERMTAEQEAEFRRLFASGLYAADRAVNMLLTELDAVRAEARDARAQLAALHKAAKIALLYDTDSTLVDLRGAPIEPGTGPFAQLRATLADTAAAAEAWTRETRARALEEAAPLVGDEEYLRERAAAIREGRE